MCGYCETFFVDYDAWKAWTPLVRGRIRYINYGQEDLSDELKIYMSGSSDSGYHIAATLDKAGYTADELTIPISYCPICGDKLPTKARRRRIAKNNVWR